MGFFTKSREKGVKSVAKEKKQKVTKATNEKNSLKTQEKKALINEIKPLEEKRRLSMASDKGKTDTSSLSSSSSSSMPWWVSDACFVVEQKKISAHKVVVSSRSKVLGALLESSPNGTLLIRDYTHSIFSQLVRWIYGGKFDVKKEDSKELGRCAKQYEVLDLYELCQSLQTTKPEDEMVCVSNITIDSSTTSVVTGLHICTEPVVLTAIAHSRQQQLQLQQQQQEDFTIELPTPNEEEEMSSSSPTMEDTPSPTDFQAPSQHSQDFGMSIWSEDPALFTPEQYGLETFHITEIY